MPYTTGLILNTSEEYETSANNVVVCVRNLSNASATIIVQVFTASYLDTPLSPLYVTGYVIPAKSADIREFFIAGNVAYEVQINNLSVLAGVSISTYGTDEYGENVPGQRVLHSELTEIPALSSPI